MYKTRHKHVCIQSSGFFPDSFSVSFYTINISHKPTFARIHDFYWKGNRTNSADIFSLPYGYKQVKSLCSRSLVSLSTNHLFLHRLICRRTNWDYQKPNLELNFLILGSHIVTLQIPDICFYRHSLCSGLWAWWAKLITPFVLGSMSVGLNILIRHSFMDLWVWITALVPWPQLLIFKDILLLNFSWPQYYIALYLQPFLFVLLQNK